MGGDIEVDDGDDRREEEHDDPQLFVAERTNAATDQVRIVGAELAGEATVPVPIGSGPEAPFALQSDESAESADRLTHESRVPTAMGDEVPSGSSGNPAKPVDGPLPVELPHWTEAPTGQVPAVLARSAGDGDEGSHPGVPGPSWREEHSDWVAHEEEFEPAMLGDDQAALGSLDESDRADAERRPWEFDLPSSGVPALNTSRDTELGYGAASRTGRESDTMDGALTTQMPAVALRSPRLPASESTELSGSSSHSDSAAFGDESERSFSSSRTAAGMELPVDGDEPYEIVDDLPGLQKSRPTGTFSVGRIGKGGLRSIRARAKRAEGMEAVTDAPLAAEPPGASVAEVPGVRRRRGGLAGLAAADRAAADRAAADRAAAEQEGQPSETAGLQDVSTDAAAGDEDSGGDRSDPSDRSDGSDRSEGPLGGGPPAARRQRESGGAGNRGAQGGRREGGNRFKLRIATGIAAAAIGLFIFWMGTAPALILSTVVVTFAAGECFGVLRRAGYRPATLLGLVGTISLMVAAYTKGPVAIPLVLMLIAVFTLLWYLFGIERGSPVAGTAATMFTVGWISLLGSYAGLLLSPSAFPHRDGIAFLLGAIIATVANDVGALVIGGWIGRHALAPKVSPNKTWEGLLGGGIFSVAISAAVVGTIHPWTPAHAALLGLLVAVVAPLGDLCESMLKRDFRIKDMGSLLPGHGGILDRIDALLFVLPATYYLVRALNIG